MEIATKAERVVHIFTIPPDVQLETGGKYTSIGMVEITAKEELASVKRARNDPLRLVMELAKQALVQINGEKVSLADQSVDRALDEMPAKVRSLVMAAYAKIHSVEEEATKGFLESQQSTTGR